MSSSPPNDALCELAQVLGLEDVRDLVRTYLRDYGRLLHDMQAGDHHSQHRATHSLKSSSRTMGLIPLAEILQTIETRLRQTGGTTTTADIATVDAELKRALPCLRAFAGEPET